MRRVDHESPRRGRTLAEVYRSAGRPQFSAYADGQSATSRVFTQLGASLTGQTAAVIAAGLRGPRIVDHFNEHLGKTLNAAMPRVEIRPTALAVGMASFNFDPMRGVTAALAADRARSDRLKSTRSPVAEAINGAWKSDPMRGLTAALAAEITRSANVASILAATTKSAQQPTIIDQLARQPGVIERLTGQSGVIERLTGQPNLIERLARQPSVIDRLDQSVDALDRVDRLPRPRPSRAESPDQPSAGPVARAASTTDELVEGLRDEVRRLTAEISQLSARGDVRRVQVTLLATFGVLICLAAVLYLSNPQLYSEVNQISGLPLAVFGIVVAVVLAGAGPRT